MEIDEYPEAGQKRTGRIKTLHKRHRESNPLHTGSGTQFNTAGNTNQFNSAGGGYQNNVVGKKNPQSISL